MSESYESYPFPQANPGPPEHQQHHPPQATAAKSAGLAITSLVLGLVGLFLSWIPIINYLAVILGVVGLVFGVIGIVKSSRGLSIAGSLLSLATIMISFVAFNAFMQDLQRASGVAPYSGEMPFGSYGASGPQTYEPLPVAPPPPVPDVEPVAPEPDASAEDESDIDPDDTYYFPELAAIPEPYSYEPEEPEDQLVVYEVSTEGSGSAMLTYTTGSGGVEQEYEAALPWSEEVLVTSHYGVSYASLSASTNPGTTSITCRVFIEGELVAEETNSGDYASVTCYPL